MMTATAKEGRASSPGALRGLKSSVWEMVRLPCSYTPRRCSIHRARWSMVNPHSSSLLDGARRALRAPDVTVPNRRALMGRVCRGHRAHPCTANRRSSIQRARRCLVRPLVGRCSDSRRCRPFTPPITSRARIHGLVHLLKAPSLNPKTFFFSQHGRDTRIHSVLFFI